MKDIKTSKPVRATSRFFNRMSFSGNRDCLTPDRLRKHGPNHYDPICAVVLDWGYDAELTKGELDEVLDDLAKRWRFAYKILTMHSRFTGLPCVLLVAAVVDLKKFIMEDYAFGDKARMKEIIDSIERFDPEKDYSKGVV